jgi:polysaccharide deacetylase family protein (PEP-CTERM system associated)
MDPQMNILTVDLEEWFVVEALSERLDRNQWDLLESTVIKNCHRLLELFRRHDTTSTWFVLGWVARRRPDLIAEIEAEGHEIGCHSYFHRRVDKLTADEFRDDTRKALDAINAAVQRRPRGYRAPSWSINDTVPWAFEVLAELEFDYDSSIFPIKHDIYGMPHGPREIHRMHLKDDHVLYEIPASTYQLMGRNIPIGGGGFLRHSPYWYSSRIIRQLNAQGQPVIVYMHPWEIDPHPPRIGGLNGLQRYRMYGSTGIFYHKLDRLLSEFSFCGTADYLRLMKRHKIGFLDGSQT